MKELLFARWISTCYADEHLDEEMRHTSDINFDNSTAMSVLNRESGHWWKEKLEYFNLEVYPNYVKNGTVDNYKKFLKQDRDCCSECGEGFDNEEEWLYNTHCGACGHPIPEELIIKKDINEKPTK